MAEDQRPNVPDCFVQAYEKLLSIVGSPIKPTPEDMCVALQHTYTLDGERMIATAPTGEHYALDLTRVEDCVSISGTGNSVAWLVWLTLQSLAGLEDEMTRNEGHRRYVRTYSDGATTMRTQVESMFFKE
jgi:hypothetical protein